MLYCFNRSPDPRSGVFPLSLLVLWSGIYSGFSRSSALPVQQVIFLFIYAHFCICLIHSRFFGDLCLLLQGHYEARLKKKPELNHSLLLKLGPEWSVCGQKGIVRKHLAVMVRLCLGTQLFFSRLKFKWNAALELSTAAMQNRWRKHHLASVGCCANSSPSWD